MSGSTYPMHSSQVIARVWSALMGHGGNGKDLHCTSSIFLQITHRHVRLMNKSCLDGGVSLRNHRVENCLGKHRLSEKCVEAYTLTLLYAWLVLRVP